MSVSLMNAPEDDGAPFLFSEMPVSASALATIEGDGEWTGARLFSQKPEIYRAVVRMLGLRFKVQIIAELLSVSDNTVRAVRAREGSAIADFRAAQGRRRRGVLDDLLERIEELAPTAELKDATLAYGILDERERLDNGAPTARIEVTSVPGTEAYREYLEKMLSPDQVREIDPQTGSERGSREQRGAPLDLPGPPEYPSHS